MATSNRSSFLLLLVIYGFIQRSTLASSTYKAAVVEFKPVAYKNDFARTLNENAEKFVTFIEQAANEAADIIVFPEFGLTSQDFPERPELANWATLVPDPLQNFTPRAESGISVSDVLKTISNAAYDNRIYVVVNLIEKDACSGMDCSLFYDSNVVFDRNGTIIARYRKFHQSHKIASFNTTESPRPSIFETDFGVTFGNVINSDIMFEEPLLNLIEKSGITDIVDTTAWSSEMPFLTTIQMQAGWACATEVNLLAAGFNGVSTGFSGSGIYAGCRVLASVLPFNDLTRLLINEVPKRPRKTVSTLAVPDNRRDIVPYTNDHRKDHVHDELRRKRDLQTLKLKYDELAGCTTELLADDGFIMKELSHGKISCTYRVNITNLSPPVTYRLVAYDGARPFGDSVVVGTGICAIVQCGNDAINSCGHIQNSWGIFDSIVINASYVGNERILMMPNTLLTDLSPYKNSTFVKYVQDGRIDASISLESPAENLITFGVWGRNFENENPNSASKIPFIQILCIPILLVLFGNGLSLL